MIDSELLRDNCAQCAALCCVMPAFDQSDLFAFDKAAATPCRNLDKQGQFCTVHDQKNKLGFAGCLLFTCHGAGQRVVQECFYGQSWHTDPTLMAPMRAAFEKAKKVHLLLSLLYEAQKLPLTPAQRAKSNGLIAQLTPQGKMSEAWLVMVNNQNLEPKVYAFLRTLRSLVSR